MPKSVNTPEYDLFRAMLVEARIQAGVGQRELARKMGVSHSILNKIESGYRRLDVVEFIKLMQLLGKDPADFILRFVRDAPKN